MHFATVLVELLFLNIYIHAHSKTQIKRLRTNKSVAAISYNL